MARFPAVLNEPLVEMYCDSTADPGLDWRDISGDVRWANTILIRHGRPDESSQASPATCSFVLNDTENVYGRRNPASPYFDSFGLGTPIRVRVTTMRAAFAGTVVNGWSTPTISNSPWVLNAVGNVPAPAAADFDEGAGVATVVVPAATNVRFAVADTADYHEDADVQVTWSMAVPVTGAEALPANLVVHLLGYTDYTYVRIGVQTDNSIQISIRKSDATVIGPMITVPGLTYVPGVDYTVRLVAHSTSMAAKVWLTSGPEPLDWHTSGSNKTWTRGVPGAVGIRTATATGNTNANLVVTYKNFYCRSDRFSGEVSVLRPGQDTSGNDKYMGVEAAGALRRLSQGEDVIQSAMRRGTPGAAYLLAYWPMEEEKEASQFSAATPDTSPLAIQSEGVKPRFAANSDFFCSAPLPVFNGAFFGGMLPDYDATINNCTQMRFLLKVPSTGATTTSVIARLWGDGTAQLWQIVYTTGGNLIIEAYDRGIVAIMGTSTAFAIDGDLIRVCMDLSQSGANVAWSVSVIQVATGVTQTATGTLNSRTLGKSTYVDFGPFANLTETAIGHITVQTGPSSVSDLNLQMRSFVGETAQTRQTRLCSENNVDFLDLVWVGTAAVGPQTVEQLLPLIREAADTDMGSLFDARALDIARLEYRSLASAYNQLSVLTVDLSLGQVAPPWAPVDDDQLVRNDVTAKSRKGGEYRATLDAGPMSTLPATEGGVGRYPDRYDVNAASDAQLPDIAGWQLALGTVDEYRFPLLRVNLGNSKIVAAHLQNAALSVNVDDQVSITGAERSHIFDDINQLVRGYTEVLGSTEHELSFNCTSATPYGVIELDPAGTDVIAYLDAETTVLHEAVTTTGTTLRVRSDTERWTATVPYPLQLAGERMTVTACENIATTLVSSSAFVHGSNATLSPALPAGYADKDVLLLISAIRNSGTGVPTTPAGYTLLLDMGNVRVFGKVASGVESAPSAAFTGGVANATTSAVMLCLRYTSLEIFAVGSQLNGSAQNIAATPIGAPFGGGACMLQVFWKADDWTTVTTDTLTTFTGSSTLGDDQALGFTLEYADGSSGNGQHSGQTFTVTGGASAISRHGALVLYGTQKMTVTRSVNGVVKAHPAETDVHVAVPARLAL
jgi:hypothetical protein